MKIMAKMNYRIVAVLVAAHVGGAMAASPEESGLKVAQESDRRNSGWVGMNADLMMLLKNAYGEQSKRNLRLSTLEVRGEGDRSVVIFDQPSDVNGTVLLTYAHVKKPDDQWIYFPAIKRTKRISSANKSGPFMGSEFAYEDMAPWELDKFTYRLLGEKTEAGVPVYELEMTPNYPNSGYTKQVVLIDKREYRPLKIDYFDRKGAALKTLNYLDYKQYLGRYWRASRMEMVNHLTKKSTTLSWTRYEFKSDLDPALFEQGSLEQPR